MKLYEKFHRIKLIKKKFRPIINKYLKIQIY